MEHQIIVKGKFRAADLGKEYYVNPPLNSYYSIVSNGDGVSADILQMDVRKYRNTLKNKFNGFTDKNHGGIFFKNILDAKNAAEWANNILLALKLAGLR